MSDNPHFETQIRVRYDEADPMGFVHHANYLRYFELCRTEALRASGGSYRQVEESGLFVVVVRADLRYRMPAKYDDLLTVRLELTHIGRAKIEHSYEITRGDERINSAVVTLAMIDHQGKVQPIPDWMTWTVTESAKSPRTP